MFRTVTKVATWDMLKTTSFHKERKWLITVTSQRKKEKDNEWYRIPPTNDSKAMMHEMEVFCNVTLCHRDK
jgi:hypothetical protein